MSVSYSVANPKLDFLCPIRISELDSEVRINASGGSRRRAFEPNWRTITVNFIAGNSVAFHMEVHVKPFLVKSIALNYLIKRYWKQEGLMKVNVDIGDTFVISVVNKEDYFNIRINGVHACRFRKMLPTSSINGLEVKKRGKITVQSIDLINVETNDGPQPRHTCECTQVGNDVYFFSRCLTCFQWRCDGLNCYKY
ncbi:galactoside-binding lectin domain-containing protein [Ditylenchus destructor]|uniref:Galectin n=1 Tax=Ditylenchus destructor TaxID=166010 RepID=A0AAD4R3W1_9BILA|nr:galactoside-binding lectin domain-containing protein [Ditylenchus destructor]